jgi:hypothetical protein
MGNQMKSIVAPSIHWALLLLLLHQSLQASGCSNSRYVKVQMSGTQDLLLVEVEVWAGSSNVATSGTATQVSTVGGYPASQCIDGNRNMLTSTQCRTTSTANAWWQLDLGSVQCIDTVVIYSVEDTTAGVFTTPTKMGTATLTLYDGSFTLQSTFALKSEAINLILVDSPTVLPTNGRYIRIEAASANVINLREVHVVDRSGTNRALAGTASQSPTTAQAAANCKDGVRTVSASLICATTASNDAFWEVDLGSEVPDLARVVLFNRVDASSTALLRANLLVLDGNRKPRRLLTLTSDAAQGFELGATPETCGIRFVRIEVAQNAALSLIEVEALSQGINLALTGNATQDSTPSGTQPAWQCNDRQWVDNIDAKEIQGCKTAASFNAWWQVDLFSNQCLDVVRVMGTEQFSTNAVLLGATVVLLNSSGVPVRVFTLAQTAQQQFYVNAGYHAPNLPGCVNARYVKLTRTTANVLAIQEVLVYEGFMNVALRAPASANVVSSPAALAVDGHWVLESKATTTNSISSWWQVDLGDIYCVDHVVVYYDSSNVGAAAGVTISLLAADQTTTVQSWSSVASQWIQTYWVPSVPRPTATRFIRSIIQGINHVNLLELIAVSNNSNVALRKPVRVRTRYSTYAVAFLTDGTFPANEDFATDYGYDSYAEVDLLSEFSLDSITYVSAKFDLTRTAGVISMNMDSMHTIMNTSVLAGVITQTIYYSPRATCGYRYVTVVSPYAPGTVSLQEVAVYRNLQNIALGKTATLSALSAVGFEAARCVDGRPFAYTADTPFATCRTTSAWGSFWQLDLGNQTGGYCIDYVQIFKSYVYPGESDRLGVLLSNTNGTVLQSFTLLQTSTHCGVPLRRPILPRYPGARLPLDPLCHLQSNPVRRVHTVQGGGGVRRGDQCRTGKDGHCRRLLRPRPTPSGRRREC